MRAFGERDAVDRLALDNPWWGGGWTEGETTALPRRAFFDAFLRRLGRLEPGTPLVLAGPRRVGKTVLVRQAIQRLLETGTPAGSIAYASLDAPAVQGLPLDRLVAALRERAEGPGLVILDAIHHARDWGTHLPVIAAAHPDARIVAVSSGGARRETPAGCAEFILPPLTFAEYLRLTGAERELIEPMFFGKGTPMYVVHDVAALNARFLHYINGGGFPEAVLLRPSQGDGARHLRTEVLGALLHQDLPGLAGIGGTAELNALFLLLARNTGREVSIEAIAEQAGIAKNTIRRYLDYLEASFLIVRMARVHPEGGRFQRMRTFKIHLTTPCLYAALFGPVGAEDPVLPALAESAVIGQWLASPERARLHYARLPEGPVDLVSLSAGSGRPSWACALAGTDDAVSDSVTINGLIQLAKRNAPLRWVGATTRTQAALKTHDGVEVWHRPASQYCYEVGRRVADEVGV
ncbi:ATP-binding protein [Azospirillum sp. sgz302134]